MEKTYSQQDMWRVMERLGAAIAERNAAYNVLERIGVTPEMIEQLNTCNYTPHVTIEIYNEVTFGDGEDDRYDSIENAIACLDRYCGPGETYDIEIVRRITHRRVVHTHTTPNEEDSDD